MEIGVRISGVTGMASRFRLAQRIIGEEIEHTEDRLGQRISVRLADEVRRRTPRGKGPPKGDPPLRLYTTTYGKVVGRTSLASKVIKAVVVGQSKMVGRYNLMTLITPPGHNIVTRTGRIVGHYPGTDYPGDALRAVWPEIEQDQRDAGRELLRTITRRIWR